LALSKNDAYLYAADSDNNILAVVDTSAMQLIATVKIGLAPERVVVGPDDTIYVSNRGERTVSVISYRNWTETARLPVGVEPVGLAVTPDNSTLYVVNATSLQDPSTGTVMAIDVKTHALLWDLPVGEEPRGIALLSNGTIAVSLYKQADVVTVDPTVPRILFAGTNLTAAANVNAGSENKGFGQNGLPPVDPPAGGPGGFGTASGVETFHPHGMATVAVSPDGKTLYAPLMWASDAIIPLNSGIVPVSEFIDGGQMDAGCTPFNGGPIGAQGPGIDTPPNGGCGCGGGGAGYGGGGGGPICTPGGVVDTNPPGGTVVMPGLATFEGTTGTALVDPVTTRSLVTSPQSFPSSLLRIQGTGQAPIQEPVAAVVDPTGSWIFVVNRASNNVAILPTTRSAVTANEPNTAASGQPVPFLEPVGNGPNGIALTADGTKAYVYNAFDHSVSVIFGQSGSVEVSPTTNNVVVAQDTLTPDEVAGRKMFFSATNSQISSPDISLSCSNCHLEGKEDGHV